MTDTKLDDLLEELVPPFAPREDGWADVLARAHPMRGRYALLAAAALALLLVPTAVALRGRIAELFEGTPAPPAVTRNFEANNKMADMATRKGFADKFPHADVSRAHGVIEIQTPDGPQDLWSAPSDQGGRCWWVNWANDPVGPAGQFGFGGCDRPGSSPGIAHGVIWVESHPALETLYGRVYGSADRLVVSLKGGTSLTLPVVEGGFLASLKKGDRIERATAYDGDREVASWAAPVG